MSVNHKVVYVPVSNDKNLLYPIYVPVVVEDPNVLLSSGKLSEGDYLKTIKLNEKCGFPIAPLLAALAPIVIPGLIKGTSKLISKIRGKGEICHMTGQNTYNPIYKRSGLNDEVSGYIPTNPNIKTLKQLQELYNKYD